MVSIRYSGRLGNNLFQYVAASIFAKKFNLALVTGIRDNLFKLPNIVGERYDTAFIFVDDNNFMNLLSSETIQKAHYVFIGYYQIKEFILTYHDEIKQLFMLNHTNTNKDDVFIAYRIGDINNTRLMLPIEYFIDALSSIPFKNGYITTDTPHHPNIIRLIDEFNLILCINSPIQTIDFAKNFNNLILSEGSFSWWMGFLSNAENIFYNERPRFWHGDIFVLPWKRLEYDWVPECVNSDNTLSCSNIIKSFSIT